MTRISVTKAKGQLTELLRQAEAGEEVVLTRHGQEVGEIIARRRKLAPEELREKRRRAVAKFRSAIAGKPLAPGTDAARAADFLYGADGMPQ